MAPGREKNAWLFASKWITMQGRLYGKENGMSRDVIKSHWPRLQGKLRAKWTKLTWEDVSFGEGDRTYLIGRLKDRYSLDEATATMRVAAFERLLS